MILYSRFGAESVESDGEVFTVGKDGGIEVPEELGRFLHNQHIDGVKAWEDNAERTARVNAEEYAKKSDPAYLASIVEELSAKVDAQPAPKKTPAKKPVYKENAVDGDGDGLVQDGTEFERPAKGAKASK